MLPEHRGMPFQHMLLEHQGVWKERILESGGFSIVRFQPFFRISSHQPITPKTLKEKLPYLIRSIYYALFYGCRWDKI